MMVRRMDYEMKNPVLEMHFYNSIVFMCTKQLPGTCVGYIGCAYFCDHYGCGYNCSIQKFVYWCGCRKVTYQGI